MRPHALWSVLLVLALAVFLGGCSVAVVHVPAIPLAPANVVVKADAADGFARYDAALASYGDWQADATYGAHWCPSQATIGASSFRPYFDGGHWTISDRAYGASPAGSIAWKSESAPGSWSDVTSHHGYWIEVSEQDAGSRWCWVPGAEESPAHVVWREGDGFVGWAPATPDEIAYDDLDYDALDWTLTFLGTLLDGCPCDGSLVGDAREIAMAATAPSSGRTSGYVPSKVPPKVTVLKSAQDRFANYTLNPNVVAAIAAQSKSKSGTDDKPASSNSGGKKSASDDSKSSDAKSASDVNAKMQARLNAMAYYDSMMMDPMFGPVGIVPRMPVDAGGGSGVAMNEGGGDVGRSRSALGVSSGDRRSMLSLERAHANGSTAQLGNASHGTASSSHASSSRSRGSSHKSSSSSHSSSHSSSSSSSGHHR